MYSEFKNYKRFPVILGPNSMILIHHFTNTDKLRGAFENQDMWEDNQSCFNYVNKETELAAKQFRTYPF